MRQLMACLTLISVLVRANIVYPQAMKVYSVEDGKDGKYTATLICADGNLYGADTDLNDLKIGETMAVLMYDNMTPGDIRDDTVIAMRRTGFFEKEGG